MPDYRKFVKFNLQGRYNNRIGYRAELALEMNNFCREHGLRNGIEFDFATYVTDDAVEFVFYVDTPIATFLALKYNNYL